MKIVVAAALLGAFSLSGCETGFTEDISRVSQIMSVLPKAADRVGIYSLREIRGSILVQYFPHQVRDTEILGRLGRYCARKGGVPRHSSSPTVASQTTLSDGRVVATRTFVAQCV